MRKFGSTGHVYFVGTSQELVLIELKFCKAGFEEIRMNILQLGKLSLEVTKEEVDFHLEI